MASIVVHCADERYQRLPQYMAKLPSGYLLSTFGCTKHFLEREVQAFFFHQLQLAQELLGESGKTVDSIALVDHLTCRAYGKDDTVDNHVRKLQEAAECLHIDLRCRGLKILLYVHNMEENKLMSIGTHDRRLAFA